MRFRTCSPNILIESHFAHSNVRYTISLLFLIVDKYSPPIIYPIFPCITLSRLTLDDNDWPQMFFRRK